MENETAELRGASVLRAALDSFVRRFEGWVLSEQGVTVDFLKFTAQRLDQHDRVIFQFPDPNDIAQSIRSDPAHRGGDLAAILDTHLHRWMLEGTNERVLKVTVGGIQPTDRVSTEWL